MLFHISFFPCVTSCVRILLVMIVGRPSRSKNLQVVNSNRKPRRLRLQSATKKKCVVSLHFFLYFDPPGQLIVTARRDRCFRACRPSVRPSVSPSPLFKSSKRKQCLLLARLWVWPNGSLMIPSLFLIFSLFSFVPFLFETLFLLCLNL